jgi:hypothetical protein
VCAATGAALAFGALVAADPAPASGAPAARCPPAAQLQGERALLRPIRDQLEARGIAAAPEAECPSLVVDVRRASPGYDLFISDTEGRMTRRQVHNADTAALLIESWARNDLAQSLLPTSARAEPASGLTPVAYQPAATPVADQPAPAGAMPDEPAAPPAPPTADGAAPVVAASASLAASRSGPAPAAAVGPSLVLLGLGAETAAGRDRALWLGGRLSACVRLGAICVGPAARWSQRMVPPPGAQVTGWARDLEASLAAEAPVRVQRWLALMPRLAAGVGRRERRWPAPIDAAPASTQAPGRRDRDRPDGYDARRGEADRRARPPGTLALAPGDTVSAHRDSARAEAGIAALVRLPSGFSLELGTSYATALPSWDRRGQLRAGLGLRYGRP